MFRRILAIAAFIGLIAIAIAGRSAARSGQDVLADYKDNRCVDCHSRITSPLKLTSKYGDWHMSLHRDKGVGCEKCHGGDPTAKDQAKAHASVLGPADPNSSVNPKNLPEQCSKCHQPVVASFVNSKHFKNLKTAGLGPSCSTCHQHMVTEVFYAPDLTAKLCASCHDSTNTLMPKRPDIPVKVDEVMQAIRRANTVVMWAERLIEQAHEKNLNIGNAETEMKASRGKMDDAKTGFHNFDLEAARLKADAAFESSTKIKEALRKQLFPGQ